VPEFSPLWRAAVAGLATLLVGLGLSWAARQLRWMDRTGGLAPVRAPVAVAAFVYWSAIRP
jgi:hypothetical protein